MGRLIILQDLPKTATESEVRELLSDVGKVISIRRHQETSTEASESFLVEMSSEEEARTVITLFDLEGIHVKLAS